MLYLPQSTFSQHAIPCHIALNFDLYAVIHSLKANPVLPQNNTKTSQKTDHLKHVAYVSVVSMFGKHICQRIRKPRTEGQIAC